MRILYQKCDKCKAYHIFYQEGTIKLIPKNCKADEDSNTDKRR